MYAAGKLRDSVLFDWTNSQKILLARKHGRLNIGSTTKKDA
jgi:hypothetical protein